MRFWLRNVCLALAAALWPANFIVAAPVPEGMSDGASLVGQVLVAAPSLPDPRFARTVILMVRHDRTGAFGIVINRPFEERPLATVLEAIGESGEGVAGSILLYGGGPVESSAGFVVHSAEYRRKETIDVGNRIAVTSSREILRDIARGRGPERALVAFGYAGWGPGQLEDEMARHDWFTARADAKLVFEIDRARVWDEAMGRRTREL